MFIFHTGDVVSTRKTGSDVWFMLIQDHTTGDAFDVYCAGKHAEIAQQVKVGQVMQVVGWSTARTSSLQYVFSIRALSGTNEKDLNKLDDEQRNAYRNVHQTIKALDETKGIAIKRSVEIEALKLEITKLKQANYDQLLDKITGGSE